MKFVTNNIIYVALLIDQFFEYVPIIAYPIMPSALHGFLFLIPPIFSFLCAAEVTEEATNVYKKPADPETKELFQPFRFFCKKNLVSLASISSLLCFISQRSFHI